MRDLDDTKLIEHAEAALLLVGPITDPRQLLTVLRAVRDEAWREGAAAALEEAASISCLCGHFDNCTHGDERNRLRARAAAVRGEG